MGVVVIEAKPYTQNQPALCPGLNVTALETKQNLDINAGMNQYIPLPTANIAAKIKSPKTISNYSEPGATYAIVSEFHLQLECCFYGSDLHFHPSQVFYRVRTDRMATGIAAHAPYSRKCASVVSSN